MGSDKDIDQLLKIIIYHCQYDKRNDRENWAQKWDLLS